MLRKVLARSIFWMIYADLRRNNVYIQGSLYTNRYSDYTVCIGSNIEENLHQPTGKWKSFHLLHLCSNVFLAIFALKNMYRPPHKPCFVQYSEMISLYNHFIKQTMIEYTWWRRKMVVKWKTINFYLALLRLESHFRIQIYIRQISNMW